MKRINTDRKAYKSNLGAVVSYLMVTAAAVRGLVAYPDVRLPIIGLLAIFVLLLLAEPLFLRQSGWGQPLFILGQMGVMIGLFSQTPLGDFWSLMLMPACFYVMQQFRPTVGWIWIGTFVVVMSLMLGFGEGWLDSLQFIIIYVAAYLLIAAFSLMLKQTVAAQQESQQLLHQLRQSNAQMQDYVTQVEELTTIKERNRLARELHDAVTQSIFSMTLITRSALILQERDPKQVKDKLLQLQELAQGALQEMRGLIYQLRTLSVAEDGLFPVLGKFIEGVNGRNNLNITLEPMPETLPLTPVQQQELYRITQEAINNIVKHAGTKDAVIRFVVEETAVTVTIADEGIGFDANALNSDHSHIGLTSMQERAKELGGTLTINAQPGAGTK
jgi:signal transduction histidine kinase